jgi:hypothetical protein
MTEPLTTATQGETRTRWNSQMISTTFLHAWASCCARGMPTEEGGLHLLLTSLPTVGVRENRP